MRTWLLGALLFLVALIASLAGVSALSEEPIDPSTVDTSAGTWFEVRVQKPRSARPLAGILPDGAFGMPPSEMRFDAASPGAAIVEANARRLELRAEGWELVIETDEAGRLGRGTRLRFTLELGNEFPTLLCRPADGAPGFLRTSTRPGADGTAELQGTFVLELAACERAATGKPIGWPPAALTVVGSFAGVAFGPAVDPAVGADAPR